MGRNSARHWSAINESSVVWGYNERYFGGATPRGQTAWFYNSQTRTMQALEISVRPIDGYAFSQINKVLKNGPVLGTYTRSVGNTDTGERAFAWIPGRGVLLEPEHWPVAMELCSECFSCAGIQRLRR